MPTQTYCPLTIKACCFESVRWDPRSACAKSILRQEICVYLQTARATQRQSNRRHQVRFLRHLHRSLGLTNTVSGFSSSDRSFSYGPPVLQSTLAHLSTDRREEISLPSPQEPFPVSSCTPEWMSSYPPPAAMSLVATTLSVEQTLQSHALPVMYCSTTLHRATVNGGTCDPFELFDAPIDVQVTPDKKAIVENLSSEARKAQQLMIWTDCDREGEHIGAEMCLCRSMSIPHIGFCCVAL